MRTYSTDEIINAIIKDWNDEEITDSDLFEAVIALQANVLEELCLIVTPDIYDGEVTIKNNAHLHKDVIRKILTDSNDLIIKDTVTKLASSHTPIKNRIFNRLRKLLSAELESIILFYGVPSDILSMSSQRQRIIDLIRYAESRNELSHLQEIIEQVVDQGNKNER